MWRNVLAVPAGLVVTAVVVMVLQSVSSSISPLPPGIDPMDPADAEAFAEHVSGLPLVTWVIVFLSELVGALLGGIVAGRVATSRKRWFSGAIVGLALLGSLFNWTSFAHPAWFVAGQLLLYPLVLFLVWFAVEPRAGADTHE
jgi:uncharacterized membrane protein